MLLHPSSRNHDLTVEADAPPEPAARAPGKKGRAADLNTPNRFDTLHLEPDPLEPDDDDFKDRVPTQFLVDATRSVLAENDSPDVGFRFSINPYRGCEHGCIYCASGDTPILLADGRTRPLGELREGDSIYGTRRLGHYRRYEKTTVRAHWEVRKPAWRVTLQDGSELVAAGDHRFLTLRGWKFVTGAQQGSDRRPHLTDNDCLLGTGRFTRPEPIDNDEYRRGYLCGMIRGDGCLATDRSEDPQPPGDRRRPFRQALVDESAQTRSEDYLRTFGVRAVDAHSRAQVDRIRQLIAWPATPSAGWSRGLLAGLFDAEGHYGDGCLRISNTDEAIIDQLTRALDRLGYCFRLEPPRPDDRRRPVHVVRVRGGLRAHLRFFHQVVPAIARKRDIEGLALKSSAPLKVESVEPLGPMTLFDITTGTGDFIADGVVSHNCYARPTHEYLGFSAGLDFETKILVKPDAPELLEAAFRKKSWQPQVVAMSGNTDCYQPVERRLQLTRRCLEVFLKYRNPVTIITKNHLVTRDLDLLAQLAALDLVHVTLSITSLKNRLAAVMEPRTSRPERRLQALQQLHDAGVPAGVNVAPLIPGLNDDEAPAILEAAAARGARWGHYIMVRLPGAVRPLFLEWLQRHFPDRAGRVVSRLKAVRNGELSDPRFDSRMRGEGELADVVARFFQLARRRHGLEGDMHELAVHHFRRQADQLQLF